MLVSALCFLSCCLILLMCQAEVGRNRHFKSVSKGQQETQAVWILAGRKWRANFACPLSDRSAARVFRNAVQFGSIGARLCPARLGLGKDWVYAAEKSVLPLSATLLFAPSVWAVPWGLTSSSFLQFLSPEQNKVLVCCPGRGCFLDGIAGVEIPAAYSSIGQEGSRL